MRVKPKKRLGQNFLADKNIRRKMVSAMGLTPEDTIVEIGPGRGEITTLIAPRVKHVTAVELDKELIGDLCKACADHPNVTVIQADFLKYDLIGPAKAAADKLKIVGNIPYYISTPIIERIFKNRATVSTAYLTIQKEFADRIDAAPGPKTYGSLTCFVQYYAVPKILFTIPNTCFFPRPKVDSAFLSLTMRNTLLLEGKEEILLFKIIRAAFNQRRKTLRNSLAYIIPKDALEAFLDQHGLTRNIRPEDLSLHDFAALARFIFEQ